MSASQPAPRLTIPTGPRSVVAGRWRRAAHLAGCVAALWPCWAAFAAGVVVAVRFDPRLGGLPSTMTAGVICWTPTGRAWSTRTFWRLRWWWDARAGGLASNAERTIFGHDDGATDRDHLVCVPRLVRVELLGVGRRYVVRPLPGQQASTFEAACSLLSMRWSAAQVSASYTPGGRYVELVVVKHAPVARVWKAAES